MSSRYIILDVGNIGKPSNIPTIVRHLINGKIKTVKGGAKFLQEMGYCPEFLELFNQLETSGSVLNYKNSIIDNHVQCCQTAIEEFLNPCPTECDDLHLFALSTKTDNAPIITRGDNRMSKCIRKLRKLDIEQDVYKRPLIIKSDKNYLSAFNRKKL